MKGRFVLFVLVAVLAWGMGVFRPTPCLADQAGVKEAKHLAQDGVALIKAGKYKQALKLFFRSKAKAEVPGINWDIARCYELMGEPAKALPYFEAFLKHVRGTKLEARAKQKIQAMKQRIAKAKARPVARVKPKQVQTPQNRHPVLPRPVVRTRTPAITSRPHKAVMPARAKARVSRPVVHARILRPVPAYSKVKQGLFWGGLAVVLAGAALNIAGYVGWKHATQGHPTVQDVDSARSSARWKFYTAYALYGTGAASIITSFFVGHGRHPLGFAMSPLPGKGAAVVLTGTW